MDVSAQIATDLKRAMLERDSAKVSILKMLKTALQYEALKSADKVLSNEESMKVLSREQKKRSDAADLYAQNNQSEKAATEKMEADFVANYLPKPVSEEETKQIVEAAIGEVSATDIKDLGKVMGVIKQKNIAGLDGGKVAQFVKQILGS